MGKKKGTRRFLNNHRSSSSISSSSSSSSSLFLAQKDNNYLLGAMFLGFAYLFFISPEMIPAAWTKLLLILFIIVSVEMFGKIGGLLMIFLLLLIGSFHMSWITEDHQMHQLHMIHEAFHNKSVLQPTTEDDEEEKVYFDDHKNVIYSSKNKNFWAYKEADRMRKINDKKLRMDNYLIRKPIHRDLDEQYAKQSKHYAKYQKRKNNPRPSEMSGFMGPVLNFLSI